MSSRSIARAAALAALVAGAAWLAACAVAPAPTRRGRAAQVPSPAPPVAKSTAAEDAGAVATSAPAPATDPARAAELAAIDEAVTTAIAAGKLPGCVVVVGRRDEVLFRKAWGSRALLPERSPMTADAVFDLASLTKPVATATSLMLLVDRGRVALDEPAARWIPELAKLPRFTVRQLLLHTSGLPASMPLGPYKEGRAKLLDHVGRLRGLPPPGERFLYSDVGFVLLGEIVRRASGEELDAFAKREVFTPLGMAETTFVPEPGLRARAAPTEQRDGHWMVGEVHDPRAFALGGVAGHAGLFSTGDDLARFAGALLADGGPLATRSRATFLARHETPRGGRTLGWDVDSPNATHRSPLLSPRAFGHGGFTGTALWLDPERDLFVVFLANRVHPEGKGEVHPLVTEIASRAIRAFDARAGIDVLATSTFAPLAARGGRIALLTNVAARARDGRLTADVLRTTPGLSLVRIFSPEHGLGGEREGRIGDAVHEGVPVTSLYGDHTTPPDESLAGVDTVVVDLQDAGVRFYTYASTMKLVLRAAAAKGLRVVVLDRPNPLGGARVEGPLLEAARAGSFVNHHRLPVRHGMTLGELAKLFVAEEGLALDLEVVRVSGWRRRDEWERTGLPWVSPSPNLRSVVAARLYPALGLLEGTNLSVGRGTEMPFEVVGAPWLDGEALAAKLRELAPSLPGVSFEPIAFTPKSSVHAGKPCRGVRARVTDRGAFLPVRTGVGLALALRAVAGAAWKDEGLDRLFGERTTTDAIRAGRALLDIERGWDADLAAFAERRAPYLLYD